MLGLILRLFSGRAEWERARRVRVAFLNSAKEMRVPERTARPVEATAMATAMAMATTNAATSVAVVETDRAVAEATRG